MFLNVIFIVFIGILILFVECDMCVVFGDYIDIYDFICVVVDGVIVLVYFEF